MKKITLKLIVILATAIIFIGVVFLDYKGFTSAPKNFVYRFLSPIQNFTYQVGSRIFKFTGAFTDSIFFADDRLQERELLTKENREIKAQLARFEEILRENEILKKQLDLRARGDENRRYVLADVISYSPNNFGRHFFINKGENNGIVKDSAVIADNILVGKVAEVFPFSARVLLISDSDSAINSLTQKTRVAGILKGDQGKGIFLEMIPQDKNIEINETIITAGLDENFPKGILIGEVAEIIENDIDVFKKAKIKTGIDFNNLEKVFVISAP